MTLRLLSFVCGGALAVMIAGCKQEPEVVTYRLTYPSESEQPSPEDAALPEAHPPMAMPGNSMPGGTMSGELPDGHPPVDMAASNLPNTPTPPSSAPYIWEAPEHWVPQASSNMRLASFQVPGPEGAGVGDCSIIRLGGMAGGIASNINRWRGQIGLAALDEATLMEQLERLPTELGEQALIVDMIGDNEAILAGIIAHEGASLFIKLRGPQATVSANRDAFRQLVASIDVAGETTETP